MSAHITEAFTGKGSWRNGARWNHKGTPVIYVSEHLSLAVLESLVHFGGHIPQSAFSVFKVEIPEAISIDEVANLPADWQNIPFPASTQDIGDTWVHEGRTAVLKVPCVIVPSEFNYVLNPLHPAFKGIRIGKPETFYFDPRLMPSSH